MDVDRFVYTCVLVPVEKETSMEKPTTKYHFKGCASHDGGKILSLGTNHTFVSNRYSLSSLYSRWFRVVSSRDASEWNLQKKMGYREMANCDSSVKRSSTKLNSAIFIYQINNAWNGSTKFNDVIWDTLFIVHTYLSSISKRNICVISL